MKASDFTLGLIRLTSSKKAQWRLIYSGNGALPLSAVLDLGKFHYVLHFWTADGKTPTLIERGNGKRHPTLINAPAEVAALAEFVRDWTRYGTSQRKAMPPVIVGREDEVPEAWERLMAEAERVRPVAEQEQAQREIFGKRPKQ